MGPVQHAFMETLGGEPVSLLGVILSGDLRGLLFEASVEQRFCNPGKENVELVYTFPLPWGAVLLGVDVVLGDKRLAGTVVQKQEAEAGYEEALADGNAAIMLERNHDGSHTLNLGNLAAGEHCSITLRYAQTLRFEQGGLRLLIPTVLAPRYGHPENDGGLWPHQAPEHSLTAEYPFQLKLRLHGTLARARVASPSHPIAVSFDPQREEADVALGREAHLDRDFVLVLTELQQQSIAVAATDSVAGGKTALLASFCPRPQGQTPLAIAVKILVDCSGSMGGSNMEAARRALQAIVSKLGECDAFSLSRFGSSVEHRSRGLWKVTERTRLSAQRWVGDLQADMGGTEMEEALQSTFRLGQGSSADVLLITDGEIHGIDDTLAAAKSSGQHVFVVGIGSSPAEAHLRRLANATGGACDFVAPGEAVEPAVLRMFARLHSARMAGVQVQWPAGITPAWTSPVPASVFDGDTVHVFALLDGWPTGELRLLGTANQEGHVHVLGAAPLPAQRQEPDTLARMAAAVRIAALADSDSEAEQAQATRLAVDYQLVTPYTNFLLLHERAEGERAADMPRLVKVRQMMPARWDDVDLAQDMAMPARHFAMADRLAFSRVLSSVNEPPAFLRKQAPVRPKQKHSVPERMQQSAWFIGPRQLCRWLQDHPRHEWPVTFAQLLDLNLEQQLIDWLLQLATQRAGDDAEATVVAAFLYLMAEPEVGDKWFQRAQREAALHMAVARLSPEEGEATGADAAAVVDPALAGEIVEVLQGNEGGWWPENLGLIPV